MGNGGGVVVVIECGFELVGVFLCVEKYGVVLVVVVVEMVGMFVEEWGFYVEKFVVGDVVGVE